MNRFSLDIQPDRFRIRFCEKPGPKIQVLVNGRVVAHQLVHADGAESWHAAVDQAVSSGDLVEVRTADRRYLVPETGSAHIGEPPPVTAGKIGIAIVTYNRLEHLKECLRRLKQHTPALSSCALVVADDGSTDGTSQWCHHHHVRTVGKQNRGVVYNKNRALFYLFEREACDQVLLIEDDCWANDTAWLSLWSEATRRYHHVNYVLAHMFNAVAEGRIQGSGTATSPFRMPLVTGQCSSLSRAAFEEIGYLDPRFVGFGAGHVEWSFRFHRSDLARSVDSRNSDFYVLRGGLVDIQSPSHKDEEQILRNRELRLSMAADAVFKLPWSSHEEKIVFEKEQNV